MASKFEATAGKLIGFVKGGTVEQSTHKNTDVTINADCGEIIMSATDFPGQPLAYTFTVNNDRVKSTDVVLINHNSGDLGDRLIYAGYIRDGAFDIYAEALGIETPNIELRFSFLLLKGSIN